MSNATDMTTPVTRGELHEELRQLRADTRADLELWGGALLARIESGERRLVEHLTSMMDQRLNETEQRLLVELARHTKAIQESMAIQIAVVDQKYADLPGRTSRLEAIVLARKRR